MKTRHLITSSILALGLAPLSNAATINIDYGNGTLHTGTAVAADLGTTWNGFTADAVTDAALVDSINNATSVTLTKGASLNHNSETGTANDLMQDYLHNGNAAITTQTVTFGGLVANGQYELILYGLGDASDQWTDFAVDAANGGAAASTTGGARDTIASPDNYVTLNATADGSGNLTYTWGRNIATYHGHNGLQLTAIPEPSSAALLGGLLALSAVMVRRR